MARRKRYVDNRLNWRDPNMPIIRKVLINGKEEIREIPPDVIEKYYQIKINNDINYWFEGYWKDDPSYNWSKKK